MKNPLKITFLLFAAAGVMMMSACDQEEPDPEYAAPTVSITSPAIPSGGLATEVGQTTIFTIQVTAEAGLSTLSVGDNVIKTFSGTETSEEVTYEYLALEEGNVTITFTVEDAVAETASEDVNLVVEPGEDLGYLLLDFAGASSASETKTVVDWDVRTLYTFSVSGSHGTTATAEVVHTQAALTFAVENPDEEQTAKVLMVEKIVPEGFDNWGGWAHIIFNLQSLIAQETIEALPTWDNVNGVTVPGTKVMKVDAYYDATVDSGFTWDDLTSLTDIWNADPSLGYKIDLAIAAYDPMGTAEGGHDGNFYMGYSAYISAPNIWETITFDMADVGRTGNFYGVADTAPGPDQIDCVKILPSPGYRATDANPLYFKNLRIVDVE